MSHWRKLPRHLLVLLGVLTLLAVLVGLMAWEFLTSDLQARYFSSVAAKMTYVVQPGPSKRIWFPSPGGPYDVRMGYSRLPDFSRRLEANGWQIARQAKISEEMLRADRLGLYPPYGEKDQAGLALLGENGAVMFASAYPQRVYRHFEDIPPLLTQSLLFIENRELLNANFPHRNPAVEWDRLAQALLDKLAQLVNPARNVPGGSTLPTQIEKYRHAPEGLTLSMSDKLRQMLSASLRAYRDGKNTLPTRKRIVKDYLNTVPLAAVPGFGEVNGVGDGLWAWYGLRFREVNAALVRKHPDAATASALKHALSLLVAERKPSYYLVKNRQALNDYTNTYLDLLASAGVISPHLRDMARRVSLRSPAHRQEPAPPPYVEQKINGALRVRLAGLLGLSNLYDLDRLDLTAQSTLNVPAQALVTRYLLSLSDPKVVAAQGMYGFRLLRPDNDLKAIVYSFTLYEKGPQGVLLRVQADNLNQPFDLNQQARLDLGSTGKFRTLITYLEIISRLRERDLKLDRAALQRLANPKNPDVLGRWMADYLGRGQDRSLPAVLNAAMARQYSAAPEPFYTGGGVHTFINFDKADNTRHIDLWEATRDSVNLVYIRVMRDIVRHYIYENPGVRHMLENQDDPARQAYLMRFIDQESRVFLARYYHRHARESAAQRAQDLYGRAGRNAKRFTAVFRYLNPGADFSAYEAALFARLPAARALKPQVLKRLYDTLGANLDLNDLGYVTRIHPLELWIARYLDAHPRASFAEAAAASRNQRIGVYRWLLRPSRFAAQNLRIRSMLEEQAFQKVLADWRRLGYPFDNLTPSYATAIGASGDRPAALAELMGIVMNDGRRLPTVNFTQLDFARGTPYQTEFVHAAPRPEQLFPAPISAVVKKALAGVVEGGTAVRLRGALHYPDGSPIPVGGKTGTGDNRYDRWGPGGQLLSSTVVNRTAAFVFYLGDRYYGTMVAMVPGTQAGNYGFTSALVAQMLSKLLPQLEPLLFSGTHAAVKAVRPEPLPPSRPGAAEAAEGTTRQAAPDEDKPLPMDLERGLPPDRRGRAGSGGANGIK